MEMKLVPLTLQQTCFSALTKLLTIIYLNLSYLLYGYNVFIILYSLHTACVLSTLKVFAVLKNIYLDD